MISSFCWINSHTTLADDCSMICYIVEMRIFVLLNGCDRIDVKFQSKCVYGQCILHFWMKRAILLRLWRRVSLSHQAAMRKPPLKDTTSPAIKNVCDLLSTIKCTQVELRPVRTSASIAIKTRSDLVRSCLHLCTFLRKWI